MTEFPRRFSPEDSQAIIEWGRVAYSFQVNTERIKIVLENYIHNVAEFNSFETEIKHYLVLSLDQSMLDVITSSEALLRKPDKTVEEKELTVRRNKILAKINLLYRNLKHAIFPCFLDDNTLPKRPKRPTKPLTPAEVDAPVEDEDEPTTDVDTSIESTEPYRPPELVIEEPQAQEQEETATDFENLHRYTPILELLNNFLIGLIGCAYVFTIIDDKDNIIAEYLTRLDLTSVSVKYTPAITYDVLIGIVDKKMQTTILTDAIASHKPFLLYISMSVLDTLQIDDECKLNLIITGKCAWYLLLFTYVEKCDPV